MFSSPGGCHCGAFHSSVFCCRFPDQVSHYKHYHPNAHNNPGFSNFHVLSFRECWPQWVSPSLHSGVRWVTVLKPEDKACSLALPVDPSISLSRKEAKISMQLYLGPSVRVRDLLTWNDWTTCIAYTHMLPYSLAGMCHTMWTSCPSPRDLDWLPSHTHNLETSSRQPNLLPPTPHFLLVLGICQHWPETPEIWVTSDSSFPCSCSPGITLTWVGSLGSLLLPPLSHPYSGVSLCFRAQNNSSPSWRWPAQTF